MEKNMTPEKMTTNPRSPTLQELFQQLKDGHEAFQEIVAGHRLPERGVSVHFGEPPPQPEFFRPKIGFVVLSKERSLSPGLIFNRPERDFFIEHSDLDIGLSAPSLERIDWAFKINRLKLIVVIGEIATASPAWTNPLGAFVEWMKRCLAGATMPAKMMRARRCLLAVHDARRSIEKASKQIQSAMESGDLALIEALFCPASKELYLDLDGGFQEQEKPICS